MLCRLLIKNWHEVQVEMLLRLRSRFRIGITHEYVAIQTNIVRLPINTVVPNAEIRTIDIPIYRHDFSKEIIEVFIFHILRHRRCIVDDILLIVDTALYAQMILQIFLIAFKILTDGCLNNVVESCGDREVNQFVKVCCYRVNETEVISQRLCQYTIRFSKVRLQYFYSRCCHDTVSQRFLWRTTTSEIIINLLINK